MRRLLLAVALLLFSTVAPQFVRAEDDRVGVGQNITVAEGDTANDIACAFCEVHIKGDVKGDVAVFMGTVNVDSSHSISGDVAILGGDLNLGQEAAVGGDVAIAAGDANLASDATIHGSRVVLPGRFWLLLPFTPFLFIIGVIWLIVYLVRRNRYQFPMYPNGRGV